MPTVNFPSLTTTSVVLSSHVGSLSVTGSVPATQSMIFRSPVLVVASAGWSRSMPVSTMPIVIPRPSQVGCAASNAAEPVSPIGMYGLSFGVAGPGGTCGCAGWLASGSGDGSGTIWSTSADCTASIELTASALSTAISTRR